MRRTAILTFMLACGAGLLLYGLVALAQALHTPHALVGASVYAAEGTEIGAVTGVTIDNDGRIAELSIAAALPFGRGVRNVAIVRGRFAIAGRAVLLDLTPEELAKVAMPAERPEASLSI